MKLWNRFAALMLALTLLFTCAAAATEMEVVEPTAAFYVADYANVLSDETENYIVSMNDRLEELTGGQIVVVTMEFLGGKDIEDYAYNLMNQWGIGSAEQNNGVLLLLSVGEADYWAMAGSGISLALTANLLGDYLTQYLEQDFAAGSYDSGVTKFFDATLGWFGNFYAVDITGTGAASGTQGGSDGLLDPDAGQDDGKKDDFAEENKGQIQKGNLVGKIAGGFLIGIVVLALVVFLAIAIPRSISLRKRGYRYGVFHPAFWSQKPPARRPAPAPRPASPGPRPGGMGRMGGGSAPANPGVRPGGSGRQVSSGRTSFGGRPTARSSMGSRPASRTRSGGGAGRR